MDREPQCPYCGWVHEGFIDMVRPSETQRYVECDNEICEKRFKTHIHRTIRFTTEKLYDGPIK
jgi:hypothetical protein